jgi:predicted ATPase
MHEYNKLVEAGKLRSDDYQTQIIQKLQALHDALALYDPPPSTGPPSLVRISPFPFRHILSYHHSRL